MIARLRRQFQLEVEPILSSNEEDDGNNNNSIVCGSEEEEDEDDQGHEQQFRTTRSTQHMRFPYWD